MSWNIDPSAIADTGPAPVHLPAGTGAASWTLSSLFETVLTGDESGGLLGAAIVTQPPGTATPLHLHTREAEAFFLLDGDMVYRAADQTFQVSAGDFVWLPAGIPHAFRVTGPRPVRFLGLSLPGGLFELYDEAGRPAGASRLPTAEEAPISEDIERWLRLAPRYGLQVIGPPLPDTHESPRADDSRSLATK
jgi:mannose-6-phosphate isomerase-like protein (cupin superfamily)